MLKKTYILVILVLSILTFSSCKTHEKMVYFQTHYEDTLNTDSTQINNSQYTPTLRPDDFLSVVITANDPESAVPFNYPEIASRPLNQGYISGTAAKIGYLIDPLGYVNLPVLGKIKLGGLNRTEATDLLEEKLKVFLKNPVVNIQIQNYKITILGEVQKPGTFNIPNERITLLEALGLSGDLYITGVRKNVLVIRDENGSKQQYRIDLTTDEVLTSPVYYLQQNDVVYVEPNNARRSQGTVWRSSGGIFISLTALILTTYTIMFPNN